MSGAFKKILYRRTHFYHAFLRITKCTIYRLVKIKESEDNVTSVKERAKKKLERDMGPLLMAALNNPKTVEIMLNADGKLWQECLGEGMKCIGTLRTAQAEAIIKTVATTAP